MFWNFQAKFQIQTMMLCEILEPSNNDIRKDDESKQNILLA
jgi:hypothetical protein